MINITPTFHHEYDNTFRGLPGPTDTNLFIPREYDDKNRPIPLTYKDTPRLPNPVFPVELYEYRRGSKIKLSLGKDKEFKSRFAELNLAGGVYKNIDMKAKVTKFIDLCRQYMNNNLEHEIDDEIRLFEATKDVADGRTLEYHYDLRETIRSFNDYLCIVFLNIANILTYPNETFYEKYLQKSNKINHDVALKMANKICKRMQDEFTEVIREIFPIRDIASRISKDQKDTDEVFDTKEVTLKKKNK